METTGRMRAALLLLVGEFDSLASTDQSGLVRPRASRLLPEILVAEGARAKRPLPPEHTRRGGFSRGGTCMLRSSTDRQQSRGVFRGAALALGVGVGRWRWALAL